MDEKEREELLIRIDERTRFLAENLKTLTKDVCKGLDEIKEHQEAQNSGIETALILATSNQNSLKWVKWIIGIFIAAFIGLVSFFIRLLQSIPIFHQ